MATTGTATPWCVRKAEIIGICCGFGVIFTSTIDWGTRNRGMFFVSPVIALVIVAGILAVCLTDPKRLGSHFVPVAQRNAIRASLIATALGSGITVFKFAWLERRSAERWPSWMPQVEDAWLSLGLASVALVFIGAFFGQLTAITRQIILKPRGGEAIDSSELPRGWLWYALGLSLLLLLSPLYSGVIPKAKPEPKQTETDNGRTEPVVAVKNGRSNATPIHDGRSSVGQRGSSPSKNRSIAKTPIVSRPQPQPRVEPQPPPRREPEPVPIVRETTPEERIEDFVLQHHAKIGLRNLDLIEADYALWVDYFSTRQMPRNDIRADQERYQTKWSKTISESVEGDIEVRLLSRERYQARYLLKTYVEKLNGEFFEARSRVELELDLSRQPPRITAQMGEVISSNKGKRRS